MKRGQSSLVSMEALALISAMCIVAIFAFAHYSRQAAAHDDQTRALAREIKPRVEALFLSEPQARLSQDVLKSIGIGVPEPMQAQVTPLKDRAEDWQITLSHPQGKLHFFIGPAGITYDHR